MPEGGHRVTKLLDAWRAGDKQAGDELIRSVYQELRRLAASYLRGEQPGHTLGATALVHEAYMRLAGASIDYQNRSHFFAVAATAMRRILVDHAKHNKRQCRGGGAIRETLDEGLIVGSEPNPMILEIDEALTHLATFDDRKARVIELIFFGGLTYSEAGDALGVSEATVKRELRLARAWILHELGGKEATAPPG